MHKQCVPAAPSDFSSAWERGYERLSLGTHRSGIILFTNETRKTWGRLQQSTRSIVRMKSYIIFGVI